MKMLNQIKWAYQRVVKGYDDRVIWSIDDYLCTMIPIWLERLKDESISTPVNKSHEDWKSELDIMIEGFKSGKKIINIECKGKKERDESFKKFNKGIKLFVKNFFDLWY